MSDDEARTQSARVIYDEARRLRDLQDQRIEDFRKRSVTVLSVAAGAVALIAGLVDQPQMEDWALYVAVAAVVGMVVSVICVHRPRAYTEGPNIQDLVDQQYNEAHPSHQVLRDVGVYYYRHYNETESVVITPIRNAFLCELVLAGVAVAAVLLGVAI